MSRWRRFCAAAGAISLAGLLAACGNTTRDTGQVQPSTSRANSGAGSETTTLASSGGATAQVKWARVGTAATPVEVIEGPQGSIWVAEKGGRLASFTVARDGELTREAVVLDLSAEVSDGLEQGLLGVARDSARGWVYVDFTNRDGDTIVRAYPDGGDGQPLDPSAGMDLLRIDQPFPNHNGGGLRIGPDGLLYIGTGDGGAAGDPAANAQDQGSLLGKILRIEPTPGDREPYVIPAENPFTGLSGGRGEVFVYGLRNPWRFTFDGDAAMWIADVGQGQWEEINVLPSSSAAGANMGWDHHEGTHLVEGDPIDDRVEPIYEYAHEDGRCSISGGVVASAASAMAGVYLFGDWCSGEVWGLSAAGADPRPIGDIDHVAAFGEVRGVIYALSTDGGIWAASTP